MKQTDFDGNFSYSKIVAVDVKEGLRGNVYPNPTSGTEFNVNFGKEDFGKDIQIKLQDVNGKEHSQYVV